MAEEGGALALKIAGMVLERKITIDEGLVKAQSGRVLDAFVEGLNILSAGNYFDVDDCRKRIRSGEAQRAVDGDIPPLEMPPELQNWTFSTTSSFQSVVREIEQLHDTFRQQAQQKEDIMQQIGLLQAYERNRPKIPNPWVSSVVVTGFALVGAFFSLVVFNQRWLALGLFGSGSALGGLLFQSEMKRYRERLQKLHDESVHRREKIDVLKKELQVIDEECVRIYKEAEHLVTLLEGSSQEQIQSVISEHAELYPKRK